MDLLTRLAERTEQLAEANVRHEHAEADLRKMTREAGTERKARGLRRKQLEADRRDLKTERDEIAAGCRDLKTEIARERNALTALEDQLTQAQHRVTTLQHQLQVAWAQLPQRGSQGGQRSWWSRLGS
jgi:chromosome segregation ATPase